MKTVLLLTLSCCLCACDRPSIDAAVPAVRESADLAAARRAVAAKQEAEERFGKDRDEEIASAKFRRDYASKELAKLKGEMDSLVASGAVESLKSAVTRAEDELTAAHNSLKLTESRWERKIEGFVTAARQGRKYKEE